MGTIIIMIHNMLYLKGSLNEGNKRIEMSIMLTTLQIKRQKKSTYFRSNKKYCSSIIKSYAISIASTRNRWSWIDLKYHKQKLNRGKMSKTLATKKSQFERLNNQISQRNFCYSHGRWTTSSNHECLNKRYNTARVTDPGKEL